MNKNLNSFYNQPEYSNLTISRKGIERLDFLILAIETLEINASDKMVMMSKNLDLHEIFPNSVELWKKRCHNPYRKTIRRGTLTNNEVYGFIVLISTMADRLYPYIRQMLSSSESRTINEKRWSLFNEKMNQLIDLRMNSNKVHIINILKPENQHNFYRHLLFTLSLSSGEGGIERLRASLFDKF